MSDTSGPTSALPSMRYDLASSSWRTSEATSLWDLETSSPTFPEWGMTRDGELYELPTPERPTVAPASSSLPTPTARDWKDTSVGPARHRPTDEDTPKGRELATAVGPLLPTPRAQLGEERNAHPWVRPLDQPQNLENAVARIGASTPPPSDAGSTSSDDPHQPPPSPEPTDDHDLLPLLWNG